MSHTILGHKTLKFIKGYYYAPRFDALAELNKLLENIISGTDVPLNQSILNQIDASNQDFTDINNQLEEIILSGYDPLDHPENYLTFEPVSSTIRISFSNNCKYSLGTNEWVDLEPGKFTPTVEKGQKIYFKSTGLVPNSNEGIGNFAVVGTCKLSGNCNSMLFGDDAETNLSLSGKNYAFYRLFYECDTIIDASQLALPATTLASQCYDSMFYNCYSLVAVPKLPATTLTYGCYQHMFNGCTSLVTAPELPATTLASQCYKYMFCQCTSLVTAPELPATTLASQCYDSMFRICKSLATAPELPATTLANYCYYSMFYGCTSLVTAPELPATTLVNYCYQYMFQSCTKLNYIKALFTTTPISTYTNNWVMGVSSSGTFIKNKNATWNVTGTYGIPTGWTVQTN